MNCSKPMISYQIANLTDEEAINQFVVRKNEFERIISEIRRDDMKGSIQHYLIIGRRGSGKSTLLRRIEAAVKTEQALNNRLIAVNLSEEQAGIYRLYDLWDYIIRHFKSTGIAVVNEPQWTESESDTAQYSRELYKTIQKTLETENKKLLVLLDNIDRIFDNIGDDAHLLREILTNFKDIRIVGASTRMSEHYWKYDKPFYQFFSIIRLDSMNSGEVKELLLHWARCLKNPDIENFVIKNPGKIDTIRVLTDGMPRTLLNFVELLIDRPKQNGYDYLRLILDRATPLYQERLNSFPPAQRKIIIELANLWEAVKVGSMTEACKMSGKTISAQLNQLVKEGVVEKIKGNKKDHLYRLSERFFNLWLLMTQGGPKEKRKVKFLTIFLENWYGQEEINRLFMDHLEGIKKHAYDPGFVAIYSTALAHYRHLSIKQRDELIEISRNYISHSSDMKELIPASSKEIYTSCFAKVDNKDFDGALTEISELEQDDVIKDLLLGFIYGFKGDYQNSEKYFKFAIEKGDIQALLFLANLYKMSNRKEEAEIYYKKAIKNGVKDAFFDFAGFFNETDRLEEAEKYYIEAIKKGELKAMTDLGTLYVKTNRPEDAEKFFKDAIEKGDTIALYNLALLYSETNRLEDAEKYYKIAINHGIINAIYNLANLYKKTYRNEEAEKYYKLAVENGHLGAMNNLAVIYQETNRFDEAEKYFLEAIEKGHVKALFNLAILYDQMNKLEKAEQFYKLAIEKDEVRAFNNLAILYIKTEKYEKAEYYFKEAIKKGDLKVLISLANLYSITNQLEKAEHYYKEAIKNGDIEAKFELANLYIQIKRKDEAVELYKQAIDSGHKEAMFFLTMIFYINNENKESALKIADKYLSYTDNDYSKSLRILMMLWNSELFEASKLLEKDLPQLINDEIIEFVILLLKEFLVHKQYSLVWQLFNNEYYGKKLKEMVLPLYYVSVGFLNPKERGEELLKPGPEIGESIEKLREEIIERQNLYK